MVTSKQGRPFLPPGLCTFFGSFVEFLLFKMGIRLRFFPPEETFRLEAEGKENIRQKREVCSRRRGGKNY